MYDESILLGDTADRVIFMAARFFMEVAFRGIFFVKCNNIKFRYPNK